MTVAVMRRHGESTVLSWQQTCRIELIDSDGDFSADSKSF